KTTSLDLTPPPGDFGSVRNAVPSTASSFTASKVPPVRAKRAVAPPSLDTPVFVGVASSHAASAKAMAIGRSDGTRTVRSGLRDGMGGAIAQSLESAYPRRMTTAKASPSNALVFFGATGDLAYKKIFPALQSLVRRGRLDGPIVGVAKSGWGL